MAEYFTLPFAQSYWVIPGKLLAGQYPGHLQPEHAATRLRALFDCGIRHVINLMEADEVDYMGRAFVPYIEEMRFFATQHRQAISWSRYPIRDGGIPDQPTMHTILDEIDAALSSEKPVYLHCWGGKGRTGTVVGCYLIRHCKTTGDSVMTDIRRLRQDIQPYAESPENDLQRDFVRSWKPGK